MHMGCLRVWVVFGIAVLLLGCKEEKSAKESGAEPACYRQALAHYEAGRFEACAESARRAADLRASRLGATDPQTVEARFTVGVCLEKAGRVADFLEFGEIMCRDALTRDESCGGHFREEHQTEEGEAVRNDADFAHAAVWEYRGDDEKPMRHVEPMEFEHVKLATRSYK